MNLEIYALSDVGPIRVNNEDAYLSLPHLRFFALADGMGGHKAGEVASKEALSSIGAIAQKKISQKTSSREFVAILKEAIHLANKRVWHLGKKHDHCKGMGTTLCLLYLIEDSVIYAHLGDSRIYRYRAREIRLLTEDHIVYNYPKRMLTRAIGTSLVANPEIASATAKQGDIFLLCSDGLTDFVSEYEIEKILQRSRSLKRAVQRLIEKAKEKGSSDNITILTIKICHEKNHLPRQ